MRKSLVDAEQLLRVSGRLGDAVIDPTVWPEILQQICTAVGATGAALLQSDERTPDIPRTPGVEDVFRNYFAVGWHARDLRAERAVPMLLQARTTVVTDQDIVTPEEMRRLPFYTEGLAPFGLQWFAAIGFWAGSAFWGLSIQRTPKEGPFEADEKRALATLAERLTETATLSKAVGRAVLSGMINALHLVEYPALALDRLGFVLATNAAAERAFDDDVRIKGRRLCLRDQRANSAVNSFVDQLRTAPDTAALPVMPIVVQRRDKRPVVIRILPIDGAAHSPFLGARALLVFSESRRQLGPPTDLLLQAFGLSPAEARLASLMARGISPEQAAEELGIARETARNQLKAVFAKTATHRQGELIALLSRL
ncbi:MAG TPA: helix-turn-helix transcriptional regulator [Xanthobacteraceae bacterium]